MYIQREISNHLLSLFHQFPCVILTGARQTGKTTLLKHLFPSYHFVSLDFPSIAELAEKTPDDFFKKYRPPLVIDEIQYAPRLFRHLKILIDGNRSSKGQFILTGSQKFILMKEVSESLAGRCALLELDTFSAKEGLKQGRDPNSSWNEFIVRGGFPELIVNPDLPSADFYRAYLATYLERDVRSLLQVGSLRDFDRFVRMAAVRSGQLLNLSEMARDVGISSPTAKQWISVLETSNQIDLLEPYFVNRGQRLVKTPKLYFRDTGLLCFLLGISSVDQMQETPLCGAIWENFLYGQLSRSLRTHSTATSLWFWRDTYGLEVDFLLDSGAKMTLLEAKWHQHPTLNEVRNLSKVMSQFKAKNRVEGKVLCRTMEEYPITDRIQAVPGPNFEAW